MSIRFPEQPIYKGIERVLSLQFPSFFPTISNSLISAFPYNFQVFSYIMLADVGKKRYLYRMNENKDLIISWVYAFSRQPQLTIHEQRLLLRIVEYAQASIAGSKLKEKPHIELGLWDVLLRLPKKAIFTGDVRHQEVIDTLNRLSERYMTFDNGDEWVKCNFIYAPSYRRNSGVLQFRVDNLLWKVLTDFSRGYRRFELMSAFKLSSSYAIRMYLLLSGQTAPIQLKTDTLKQLLGIDAEKYTRSDNFEMRVLVPSQQQLNEHCPYSFTYEKVREADNNRSPVIGYRFYPKYLPNNRDSELEQHRLLSQISLASIPDEALHYLRDFGFTEDEIRRNKPTLLAACELFDLTEFLCQVSGRARQAKNPKGYIVNAIKKAIKEHNV